MAINSAGGIDGKKNVLKSLLSPIISKVKSMGKSYNDLYKKKSDEFTAGVPTTGKAASAGNMLELKYLRDKKLNELKNSK